MRIAPIACVVAILAAASAASGQDTTLRYRWVKGENLRYRMTLETTVAISGLPGIGVMTVDQNTVELIRFAVDDVDANGEAALRQTFESLRMEVRSPMGTTVFDTAADPATRGASDPAAALWAAMSALIDEPITVSVTPTGAVTKIEGVSRIFATLAEKLPIAVTSSPEFNQLKASMTDDAMRSLFEQGLAVFPDHPVRLGEAWTSEFRIEVPVLGPRVGSRTATLKGVDVSHGNAAARIAIAMSTKPAGDSAPGPMGMVLNLADARSEGEVLFDLTNGRVQHTLVKTEMPMTMSMPGPDGSSTKVEGVVRGSVTMELVDN